MLASWGPNVGPDPGTRILRLDGNLVPGLSGAPLIDASGAVAGIGSGGLENGAVGISWAVRSEYLERLPLAPRYTGGYHSSEGAMLFSAPLDETPVETMQCGSATFYKAKSRSLRSLLETADDTAGLAQVASTTALPSSELLALGFDIYTEPTSGASVAVPLGVALVPSDEHCIAEVAPGIRLRLAASPASNRLEVQEKSDAFEAAFPARATKLYWMPDPTFTYAAPLSRADGLTVRRKTGLGFRAGGGLPTGETFETIMARGSLFVGFEVLNTKFSPPDYQRCLATPAVGDCPNVNRDYRRWVSAVLGVHLSTFPQN